MRLSFPVVYPVLCVSAFPPIQVQTKNPTFLKMQIQTATTSGNLFSTKDSTATAKWTAGSDKESESAQLRAKADGSTKVQLSLGKARRAEAQIAFAASPFCPYTPPQIGNSMAHAYEI